MESRCSSAKVLVHERSTHPEGTHQFHWLPKVLVLWVRIELDAHAAQRQDLIQLETHDFGYTR